MTPGGLNPNLTSLSALSAIGADQLRKERHADGQRRRSKHRGSFHPQGLERWKASIENYVASVQPGNQTALNTARVPFASYLNRIHQRLHDVFALGFLRSLDSLPNDHSLNRRDLHANLEIVLSREDGRIVRMGVTRASGSTAFDVGALEAVQKASPYGAPPREIVSPDGNVYLHWEFYRDPMNACSTYFARPYILHVSPTPAPIIPPPTRPASPTDREQHGRREQHLDGQGKGG
jgi:TonB family protein